MRKASVWMVGVAVVAAGCSQSGPDAQRSLVTAPSAQLAIDQPPPPPDPAPATGRFTGGGFQITSAGVKVTRGFTIHCDLLLSNNLEINWNGHRFHMNEHTTTVSCTDGAPVQAPPAAPVDTIVGVGTGRYDGVDGYTIEFTLVDGGEPGGDDMAALRVYNGSGDVLNIPLTTIDGGNIQAHFDQPHK